MFILCVDVCACGISGDGLMAAELLAAPLAPPGSARRAPALARSLRTVR